MYIEITSPSETVFSGTVISARVPGASGSFTILKNHAPVIALLVSGDIIVETEDHQVYSFQTEGGVVEVKKNNIIILSV